LPKASDHEQGSVDLRQPLEAEPSPRNWLFAARVEHQQRPLHHELCEDVVIGADVRAADSEAAVLLAVEVGRGGVDLGPPLAQQPQPFQSRRVVGALRRQALLCLLAEEVRDLGLQAHPSVAVNR